MVLQHKTFTEVRFSLLLILKSNFGALSVVFSDLSLLFVLFVYSCWAVPLWFGVSSGLCVIKNYLCKTALWTILWIVRPLAGTSKCLMTFLEEFIALELLIHGNKSCVLHFSAKERVLCFPSLTVLSQFTVHTNYFFPILFWSLFSFLFGFAIVPGLLAMLNTWFPSPLHWSRLFCLCTL